MKYFINPPRSDWARLAARPTISHELLDGPVREILKKVKQDGDAALRELTLRYDGYHPDNLTIPKEVIDAAVSGLDPALRQAIEIAASNIRTFHSAQARATVKVDTMQGVTCWRKSVPIEKVGIYIPGGTAPLFSTVLMLGIPSQLAGCKEVHLCTPPGKDGTIHPAILFAADYCGISNIHPVGGAQAIAALAYGTPSIPAVSKIFGPGNQYVTRAKQLVAQEGVVIDMPAGPSEVLVYADQTAVASFIAADLLSQAEHGPDSQVVLVSREMRLLKDVEQEISKQLETLPRANVARKALDNSMMILIEDDETAVGFINEYAPEHLILQVKDAEATGNLIINAGSVFLGIWTPEAVGDYASGTNHTLPTNGFAKTYSGVSLDSFIKTISFQTLTPEGIQQLGPAVEKMAAVEQLEAHQRAVSIRLQKLHEKD